MSVTAPDDAFLDVNDAHLRVFGNVHADGLKLGQLEVVTTTSTGSTIQFLHQHTAFTTTSNIEVGTTNHDLFVDTNASRVGILTNTPTTALDVNGTVKATAFDGDGALLTGIPSSAINGTLSQWTTVTGPKIHYSDGNVGIGIADPLHTLDVVGDINFTGTLREDGNPFVSTPWTIETSPTALSYTSGNVGIGAATPSAKLEVTGNAHVTTDLSVGGTLSINTITAAATHALSAVTAVGASTGDTLQLTNATTGLVTTGNVEVGRELTVSGNATVSSNLTVSGNVEVAKELTVTGNATISSNLTVNGHIHQEDGRWKFDFENRRPENLMPTTEFRYVVVEGTTDFPSSYQTNTKYVVTESGTTVYQYTPSTDTTTTLISSTSSDDTVGSIALTAGTEIFTTSVKPFVLAVPGYNHAVIPFRCRGYYFGFANTRYLPTTIFMYAPYEDVTVNLYFNKAITETPTETFTLTKQTVVTRTINPSYSSTSSWYGYMIEAVNGVIMASRSGSDAGSLYNGDHEILYPASNLGYNMTSSTTQYYNHDVFNTGGYEEGKNRFSSGVVQTGPTFYSPAGIPHFSSCGGDGDGGETTSIIPHEIVGEVYYIPHTIPGYMIGFLTNRQTVTAQYYHGGQWYTENATTGPRYAVSAYNCIPVRRWEVGSKLDGSRSSLSGNMLTSTLWKFTSDHPFVLRVESQESSATGDWDEYMAIGWLNSTRTTPIYKPPCLLTPVMYPASLVTGVNVNAGAEDTWTEYNIFDEQNTTFNRVYGGGFSTYGTGTRIIVPAPGFYRCTATVYLYRTDTVSSRTTTEMQFSRYNGSGAGTVGESYIRLYEGHTHTSMSITDVVDLSNPDWNDTSTDVPPHIGLLFRRAGTITEGVYISSGTVVLELIR